MKVVERAPGVPEGEREDDAKEEVEEPFDVIYVARRYCVLKEGSRMIEDTPQRRIFPPVIVQLKAVNQRVKERLRKDGGGDERSTERLQEEWPVDVFCVFREVEWGVLEVEAKAVWGGSFIHIETPIVNSDRLPFSHLIDPLAEVLLRGERSLLEGDADAFREDIAPISKEALNTGEDAQIKVVLGWAWLACVAILEQLPEADRHSNLRGHAFIFKREALFAGVCPGGEDAMEGIGQGGAGLQIEDAGILLSKGTGTDEEEVVAEARLGRCELEIEV